MAVRVAQASIDENGRTRGGKAGNQSGKELNIRSWYNKPWSFVLRPRDSEIAEKIAKNAEIAVNNKNIGYDQNQRNTLHTLAKANGYDLSSVGLCETDCSALVTCCCIASGVSELEYSGNAPTTATMKTVFASTGKFDLLTTSTYVSKPDFLHRGDILVRPGYHTCVVLDNGSCIKIIPAAAPTDVPKPTLRYGDKGEEVKRLQNALNKFGAKLEVDGDFGKLTKAALKKWQKANNLESDGIYGQKSYQMMYSLIVK